MDGSIKVLFIILNYKTYEETVKLVNELNNDGLGDKYILIVDNASPNESYEVLCNFVAHLDKVEVILSPENGGFAKGNNFGLRYAKKLKPKYVCIINNDVHFPISVVDRLCIWYERLPNVAMIAPVQILPNGEKAQFGNMDIPNIWIDMASYIPYLSNIIYKNKMDIYSENTEIEGVHRIGLLPGAFSFVSYNLIEDLGFFDELTFLFCEERFFAQKAKKRGLYNYIILNEHYLHQHSMTISSEASKKKQREMMFRERCKYHRQYSKNPRLCCMGLAISFYIGELFETLSRWKGKITQL